VKRRDEDPTREENDDEIGSSPNGFVVDNIPFIDINGVCTNVDVLRQQKI